MLRPTRFRRRPAGNSCGFRNCARTGIGCGSSGTGASCAAWPTARSISILGLCPGRRPGARRLPWRPPRLAQGPLCGPRGCPRSAARAVGARHAARRIEALRSFRPVGIRSGAPARPVPSPAVRSSTWPGRIAKGPGFRPPSDRPLQPAPWCHQSAGPPPA
eukprot:7751451-Pyramimonas_sp.AAC.1